MRWIVLMISMNPLGYYRYAISMNFRFALMRCNVHTHCVFVLRCISFSNTLKRNELRCFCQTFQYNKLEAFKNEQTFRMDYYAISCSSFLFICLAIVLSLFAFRFVFLFSIAILIVEERLIRSPTLTQHYWEIRTNWTVAFSCSLIRQQNRLQSENATKNKMKTTTL